MTMLLMDAIEAEVVPVEGQEGWFRLTGKDILLVDYPAAIDYIEDAEQAGLVIHYEARIEGMHDEREECLDSDPRFNYEADKNFAVIEQPDGKFVMVLDMNWPETVVLRHLIKRRGYEDQPLPAPEN